MVNERIKRFNYIANNIPAEPHEKDKFWEQAILQSSLILEEAREAHEAALKRDIVEYVDGVVDTWYLHNYAEHMLEQFGVLLYQAKDQVCLNNDSKYTRSKDLAEQSKNHHNKSGNPCYVQDVEYQGETYYIVKRMSDGKVQKLLGHQKPNIASSIPEEVMKALEE